MLVVQQDQQCDEQTAVLITSISSVWISWLNFIPYHTSHLFPPTKPVTSWLLVISVFGLHNKKHSNMQQLIICEKLKTLLYVDDGALFIDTDRMVVASLSGAVSSIAKFQMFLYILSFQTLYRHCCFKTCHCSQCCSSMPHVKGRFGWLMDAYP